MQFSDFFLALIFHTKLCFILFCFTNPTIRYCFHFPTGTGKTSQSVLKFISVMQRLPCLRPRNVLTAINTTLTLVNIL